MRIVDDVHTTPILTLKFFSHKEKGWDVISSDKGGNVYNSNFRKMLWKTFHER